MSWPDFVREWGTTSAERARAYPCDARLEAADDAFFRAVDVDAPAAILFRWLCQLRVAPYSYDLLDNLGRRSPQTLVPGLDQLAVGQRVMTIFRLVDFEPGRSLTARSRGPLFGEVVGSYVAEPRGSHGSRLLVKFVVDYDPVGRAGRAMRLILPPGDLFMMRRQLLNLKRLAERDAATAATLCD